MVTFGRPDAGGAQHWEPAMDFTCTARQLADHVLLTVAGDVDLAIHTRFESDIDHAWDGASDLVMECSGVSFMDSMGLQVLVKTMQRAAENGSGFTLAAPSAPVARILDLAGVEYLFTVAGAAPGSASDSDSAV